VKFVVLAALGALAPPSESVHHDPSGEPSVAASESTAPPDTGATEPETPDHHDEWAKKFGGYGEIEFPFTAIDGRFASFVGGGAGFIILDRMIVGARGYGLAYTDKSYEADDGGSRELALHYGGADLGAYIARGKVVESAAHWLVAGGRGCLNEKRTDVLCGQTASLFVTHLELSVYFKIAKVLRIGAGFGYRFVVGSDLDGPRDRQLSGGYGTLKIALGRF
jgi:hypothetical protein